MNQQNPSLSRSLTNTWGKKQQMKSVNFGQKGSCVKFKVVCLQFRCDLVFSALFAAFYQHLESFLLLTFGTSLHIITYQSKSFWVHITRARIINCHFHSNLNNQSQHKQLGGKQTPIPRLKSANEMGK